MSSYTAIVNKVIDDGIFFQDINELKENIVALAQFPKRIPLGGDPKRLYIGVDTYELIEDAIYGELDGTNLGGLTYELHFMGLVTTPDTGKVKLIRLDTLATVVEKLFTNTALDLVKSDAFSLVTASVQYAVHVTPTTGTVASPMKAYGFHLIQR